MELSVRERRELRALLVEQMACLTRARPWLGGEFADEMTDCIIELCRALGFGWPTIYDEAKDKVAREEGGR